LLKSKEERLILRGNEMWQSSEILTSLYYIVIVMRQSTSLYYFWWKHLIEEMCAIIW
jgi:hypothetical protein